MSLREFRVTSSLSDSVRNVDNPNQESYAFVFSHEWWMKRLEEGNSKALKNKIRVRQNKEENNP